MGQLITIQLLNLMTTTPYVSSTRGLNDELSTLKTYHGMPLMISYPTDLALSLGNE